MLQGSSILCFCPVSVSLKIRQVMPILKLSIWLSKKFSILKRELIAQWGGNNAKHKTLKN